MSHESSSFFLLDERIQRFIWAEGWESLRDAQEAAIPLILPADRDVIVAAATAAGKTEAALLPALTHLVQRSDPRLIAYVSPLKALINDQFGRLERLCEDLEVPVWPWHGDVPASTKKRFLDKRAGVLLITPESLEALLCNRGSSVASAFAGLSYFVVDELHAFIGSERGKQLQSLLHRIEQLVKRRIPRIGLSATLGDMELAREFLRPGHGVAVAQVVSSATGSELKILVKGYEEPLVVRRQPGPVQSSKVGDLSAELDDSEETDESAMPAAIASHLFNALRGTNNLVFPNSRRDVERYSHLLAKLSAQAKIPNEFWPHHGNLSKEIRAETEAALKQRAVPATAVCTNTLELGIDIGAVRSVAQIGPPPSVASLRQRLGRSGRRKGEPATLRGYCIEDALDARSSLATELRLGTVQFAAMISLLLEGWFEPPVSHGRHYSTLIQQILSYIAQNGGATIARLYDVLCSSDAPFAGLEKREFAALVRHLGKRDLLMQDPSGELLHGGLGERIVNHYSFYAAFAADEEFRIVHGGRTLGSLPVSRMLYVGQPLLFAGRTWRVDSIEETQRTISVTPALGGAPPEFPGGTGRTHTRVRQRMRDLLESDEVPSYLDPTARNFLSEGRANYLARRLGETVTVDLGQEVLLLTWLGDAANEALACLLRSRQYSAFPSGLGVEVSKGSSPAADVLDVLSEIATDAPPDVDSLLFDVSNLRREKWDWALSDGLLRRSYASLYLDIDEAMRWIEQNVRGKWSG